MITRFIHLLVLSGFIFSLHCTSVSLCCCKAQLVRCSDACCELIVFCKFESERNYVLDLIVRDQLFKSQKQVLRQRVSKRIILVICKWAIELDTGSSSSTCPPSSINNTTRMFERLEKNWTRALSSYGAEFIP